MQGLGQARPGKIAIAKFGAMVESCSQLAISLLSACSQLALSLLSACRFQVLSLQVVGKDSPYIGEPSALPYITPNTVPCCHAQFEKTGTLAVSSIWDSLSRGLLTLCLCLTDLIFDISFCKYSAQNQTHHYHRFVC